jgi:hypothetical protein
MVEDRKQQWAIEDVKQWAELPGVLRRGETIDGVEEAQRLLAHFGINPGPIDDIFGGMSEAAVTEYQQRRFLAVDGEIGPQTKGDMIAAVEYGWKAGEPFPYKDTGLMVYGGIHPQRGLIPADAGKLSWFGGPDDEGDRGYGQALIHVTPSTVEALYKQHPGLVELGLFRKGLSDPLPMTTCCGRSMRAGISWCLDPMSFYLAMRWARHRYPDPYHDRVAVIYGDKIVIVAPTDWGPHIRTGKNGDLSLGAMQAIEARTGHRAWFTWAEDDTPLGLVA